MDELAVEDRDRPSDADVEVEEMGAEVEVIETAIREKAKQEKSHLERHMLPMMRWDPAELNKRFLYSTSTQQPPGQQLQQLSYLRQEHIPQFGGGGFPMMQHQQMMLQQQ